MERANKCVGKKAYAYKDKAISVGVLMYEKHGTRMAVYECPTCLDFHLTSKWCNLQQYYKPVVKKGNAKKMKVRRYKTNLQNRKRFIYNVFSQIDYPQFLFLALKWLR